MHRSVPALSPDDFRCHASELRKRYGPQPWLTVASGVIAEGYRLAGFSSLEFFLTLLQQTEQRRNLLLHLRRKPLIRLRAGFDGHSGGISDEDGVLVLHLHFNGGGSYQERHLQEGSTTFEEGARLRLPGRARSSLLITGGLLSPLASVFPNLPRCLHPRSVRTRRVTQHEATWYSGEATVVDVVTHWETLSLMPRSVSRELNLPEQLTLDQIPWMPEPHPVRLDPVVMAAPVAGTSAMVDVPARARPALSLVSSS